MNKLLLLTKINLLTFFDIYKIKASKDGKELQKAIRKFLIILVGLGLSIFYIYIYADMVMEGYIVLKIPYVILGQFMAITSIFLIFTNIYKINGTLFGFKDYDLLMSLPIDKKIIIISKLILLYISNLIYTLLIMIPVYICYIKYVEVEAIFHVLYFVTLFIIPLIPMILSTIVGSIITGISSKFKHKNFFNIIFTLSFVILIMYMSSAMENKTALDMANIGKSLVDIFNNYYPLTNVYMDILYSSSLSSGLIFIGCPVILFGLFMVIITKYYNKINDNLKRGYKEKNTSLKKMNKRSSLMSLYNKELKRYFSSYNYVLNTAIGPILLTICTVMLIFAGSDKIDSLIGIEGLSLMLIKSTPLIMGIFCAVTCTTHSSISLEGKNLWILKTIPTDTMTIFISKALVNLTILIPTIIINAIALTLYLKLGFVTFILIIITSLAYSILSSLLGVAINLNFPNFTWSSEIRVIKQSMAALVSLLLGAGIGIVPLIIETDIDSTLYVIIVTIVVMLIDGLIYYYLKKEGKRKFKLL